MEVGGDARLDRFAGAGLDVERWGETYESTTEMHLGNVLGKCSGTSAWTGRSTPITTTSARTSLRHTSTWPCAVRQSATFHKSSSRTSVCGTILYRTGLQ